MATFSQRKTGTTMTSWEYYVQDKEDWERYKNTLKVEFTTKNQPILFKDTKGSSTIGSPLSNGTSLILLSNKSFNIEKKIHAHTQGSWCLLSAGVWSLREKNILEDGCYIH